MKMREIEFDRSPIVENEVFFLQSKCVQCGFTILSSSLDDLLKQENRHRGECASDLLRAAV